MELPWRRTAARSEIATNISAVGGPRPQTNKAMHSERGSRRFFAWPFQSRVPSDGRRLPGDRAFRCIAFSTRLPHGRVPPCRFLALLVGCLGIALWRPWLGKSFGSVRSGRFFRNACASPSPRALSPLVVVFGEGYGGQRGEGAGRSATSVASV